MTRPVRCLLPLLVCAALSACDGSAPEERPVAATLTGRWQGQVASRGTTYTFELNLTDNRSEVSGTGTLSAPSQPIASYAVFGTFAYSNLNLRLTFNDRPPVDLTGRTPEDISRIDAAVSGAGFGGEAFHLVRK